MIGARALADLPRLPVVDAGVHLSVEGDDRLLDALADQCRVGVGVPHPGPVDDDDVGGAGVASDPLAEAGQNVLGVTGFDRAGDAGGVARG